MKSDHFRMKC